MNLLPLADGPDGAVIAGSAGPALFGGRGGGLMLGLRPESLALEAVAGVPVRVEAIEYPGSDSIVVCRIGGRSDEHTFESTSTMCLSYDVFCYKEKNTH